MIKIFQYLKGKLNETIKKILSFSITPEVMIEVLLETYSKKEFFYFNNNRLEYFDHSYNNRRLTEREIEIPIIGFYFKKTGIRKILEIGNVTNHYYTYFQDLIDDKVVVDRYEKGFGVISQDVRDFKSDMKFDLIVSISTFEHMDSDRNRNKDYEKGKSELETYAASNILYVVKNLLKKNGCFIITAPISYAEEWDQTVFELNILNSDFLEVKSVDTYFFKKISQIEWIQTNLKEAKKAKLNTPFRGVNLLSVIEINK